MVNISNSKRIFLRQRPKFILRESFFLKNAELTFLTLEIFVHLSLLPVNFYSSLLDTVALMLLVILSHSLVLHSLQLLVLYAYLTCL